MFGFQAVDLQFQLEIIHFIVFLNGPRLKVRTIALILSDRQHLYVSPLSCKLRPSVSVCSLVQLFYVWLFYLLAIFLYRSTVFTEDKCRNSIRDFEDGLQLLFTAALWNAVKVIDHVNFFYVIAELILSLLCHRLILATLARSPFATY